MKKFYCAWLGKKEFMDAPSIAVTEDGKEFASWVSSSKSFAKLDLRQGIENKLLNDEEFEMIWVNPKDLPVIGPGFV